ncbi:hypothetical protein [Chlorobium phaeobacteroides]|uniref:Uncharacterized protein n=1 Tax=Chlorobium phaeobacteroides (strain DSM 266 / SMG 266 / 2430) TaxID=290317 RepID=A1BEW9_CHLPD|nr:hypothetical protein [Chlorobium phaeobacteroides]ABL64946.1 hypothetical protein Cpha266_0898 [Chlorobium phaeobacteroides DSM 266]
MTVVTVEEIIRMFDNPAILGEALLEAEKLPFVGDDRIRFKQKQQRYIDGLSDHERPQWVGEMKNFLHLYDAAGHESSVHQSGNYIADTFNRWHYLDKQYFRKQLKEICRDRDNPVKVLFIEEDTDAFSDYTDEILRSFIKADHGSIHETMTATKGEMSHVVYLENRDQLREEWTDFMAKFFDLSASCEKIPEEFRRKGFHRESHIIVHSVDQLSETFLEEFQLYYNFWTELSPQQPIFLCLYLPEHSLPREVTPLTYWILCYCDQYETVEHRHFTRFFRDFKCYRRDDELCRCNTPMCFSDAVNKLHYCQPSN